LGTFGSGVNFAISEVAHMHKLESYHYVFSAPYIGKGFTDFGDLLM